MLHGYSAGCLTIAALTARWTGHASSAAYTIGYAPAGATLGSLSVGFGGVSAGLEYFAHDNEAAFLGLIVEGGSEYIQQRFVPMLPKEMTKSADIYFEVQQTLVREGLYQVGK